MKLCKKCDKEKPLSEFYKNRKNKDGYYFDCKVCWNEYQYTAERKLKRNKRNLRNKMSEKRRDYHRNYAMKKKYGISLEQFHKMLLDQNGKCAICDKDHDKCQNGLYVDHNHETKKVRKLLCKECNVGLGFFMEKVEFMQNAINYLNEHNE